MTFSFHSFLGAFVFLVIGLFALAIHRRFVHPKLREKYERAKATGTQGRDPAWLARLVLFFDLVIIPIVGFLLGDTLFNG